MRFGRPQTGARRWGVVFGRCHVGGSQLEKDIFYLCLSAYMIRSHRH